VRFVEHMTARERFLVYWMLRSYDAMSRAGWEEGPSAEETRDDLCAVLANINLDPNESEEAFDILHAPPSPL
jgi:hypothetical protein